MSTSAQTPPHGSASRGLRLGRHGLVDTSPEADRLMIELLRQMTPAQRIARVRALVGAARRLALADLSHRYPAESRRGLTARLAARLYPAELVRAAYGPPCGACGTDVERSD